VARKKKKAMRRVRKASRAKGRRKTSGAVSRRKPARHKKAAKATRRKTSKLVSRAVGGSEKAPPHRKRARAVATRNPAREFVIEAYAPKGRKFFYYRGDDRLTTSRADAARYKSGPEAHRARLTVARRAPAGIHWVRVCPA